MGKEERKTWENGGKFGQENFDLDIPNIMKPRRSRLIVSLTSSTSSTTQGGTTRKAQEHDHERHWVTFSFCSLVVGDEDVHSSGHGAGVEPGVVEFVDALGHFGPFDQQLVGVLRAGIVEELSVVDAHVHVFVGMQQALQRFGVQTHRILRLDTIADTGTRVPVRQPHRRVLIGDEGRVEYDLLFRLRQQIAQRHRVHLPIHTNDHSTNQTTIQEHSQWQNRPFSNHTLHCWTGGARSTGANGKLPPSRSVDRGGAVFDQCGIFRVRIKSNCKKTDKAEILSRYSFWRNKQCRINRNVLTWIAVSSYTEQCFPKSPPFYRVSAEWRTGNTSDS